MVTLCSFYGHIDPQRASIMYFYLLPSLAISTAVATLVSPSTAAQKPLGTTTSANFVRSSIFARDENDILDIEDPIGLKPTFQWRSFANEEDELLYSGGTFAHLPAVDCFDPESSGTFDVAIVGHPFDLGVTYRPGARFGPNGARQGARRISPSCAYR